MVRGNRTQELANARRRSFLKATGTLVVSSAFAGCTGSEDDGGDGSGGADGADGGDGSGGDGGDGTDGATTSDSPETFTNEAGVEIGADFETVKELAAEEDAITFYSAQDREPVETWSQALTEAHPEVELNHVTGSGDDLLQRWNSEYKSDNVAADVFSAMGESPAIWKNDQAMELSADFMPAYGEVPDEFKSDDDVWVTLRLHMASMVFNTEMVSQDAVSSYMEVVEDDRWADQNLGWDPTPNLYYMNWFYDNFGREFFTKLAEQRPRWVDSHTDLVRFGGAGEFPINFTYTFNIAKFPPDYPVDYFRKGIDTMPGVKAPIMLNNKAPNPNSAIVFLNWLISEEGQQTVGETAYLPWHPDASFDGWPKSWDLYPSDDYDVDFMSVDQDFEEVRQVWDEELGHLLS